MKPFFKDYLYRSFVLLSLIMIILALGGGLFPKRGFDRIPKAAAASRENIIKRVFDDPGAFSNLIVAAFTGVLSIVSIAQIAFLLRADRNTRVSAEAALKAANASEKSLTLSRQSIIADRRAWLEVSPVLSNQPLHSTADNINTSVSMRFRNTGNTPALNISMDAWILPELPPSCGKPSLIDRHRGLCVVSKEKRIGTGYTLFPGERFPSSVNIGEFGLGVGIQGDAFREAVITTGLGNILLLYIGGVVNYTFPTDMETVHQSSFLMRIETKPPRIGIQEGQPIPVGEMYLGGVFFGDGRLAD